MAHFKKNKKVIGFGTNEDIRYYVFHFLYVEYLLMPENEIRDNDILCGLENIARAVNNLCGKKVCIGHTGGIKWNYQK